MPVVNDCHILFNQNESLLTFNDYLIPAGTLVIEFMTI